MSERRIAVPPRTLLRRLSWGAGALLVAAAALVAGLSLGATFSVTTTADVSDGDTSSITNLLAKPGADGKISLREAITAANNTTGTDTLTLPAGTYTLSAGDLIVTKALIINGASSATTTISGNLASRIFSTGSASLTLTNMTLTRGRASTGNGGAILRTTGTLKLTSVILDDNAASNGHGGAVYGTGGTYTWTTVTLSNNRAGLSGGAVYKSAGSLRLTGVTLSNNQAANGSGGAVWFTGTLMTMATSTASGNTAGSGNGGALFVSTSGTSKITGSTLSSNQAFNGSGGAAQLQGIGSWTISDATVSGNSAPLGGGGLSVAMSGNVSLTRVTLDNNTAINGTGGGLLVSHASGGAFTTTTNVTLYGNTAGTGGGGAATTSGKLSLVNTTVASNTSTNGAGGLSHGGGEITTFNTLVASNTGTAGNCAGTIKSTGYSLDTGKTCGFGSTGDKSSANAALGPFGANGGTTRTVPIGIASAAVNAGTSTGAPANDQRGYARLGATDIGAYEYGGGTTGASITGAVFEDLNYGGGAGRDLAAAQKEGATGRPDALVELYDDSGNFLRSTSTAADGSYAFTFLVANTYTVRVVNGTVRSGRAGATDALIPVQTFRTDASSGAAMAVTDRVGGQTPAKEDAGAGTSTLADLATAGITPQSLTTVKLAGTDVSGVDFGFSFNVVVNTNDTGQGSLSQVVDNANALSNSGVAISGRGAGIDHVVFMLPDGTARAGMNTGYASAFNSGVASIALSDTLSIDEALVIDGQTQPGWTASPVIELNGSPAAAGTVGISTSVGGNILRGLTINRFDGGGVLLNGGGNTVQGCWIGLASTGSASAGNKGPGITVLTGAADQLGGIGTGNVIAGNTGAGIQLRGSGTLVQGNRIGQAAAVASNLPNAGGGVLVSAGTGAQIGSLVAGTGNLIAGNTTFGVAVATGSSGHTIRGNSIYGNSTLGIDLGSDGATANDGAKTAGGANLRMDKPVLTRAVVGSSTLSVVGYVGSAALQSTFASAWVDVYVSDGSSGGSGKTWVGTLTTNSDGEFAGTLATSGVGSLTAGSTVITATATDAAGNTSEFAANATTSALAALQNGGFESGVAAGATFITRVTGDTLGVPPWVVTGHSIEVIGGYWQHAEGSRSLDLSGNARGGVAQVLQTVAGQAYSLRFAVAANSGCGSATKVLRVTAGSTTQTYSLSAAGRSTAAMGWQEQTLAFTAAAEATVVWFESLEASACGPALDNVLLGAGGSGAITGTVFEDVNYGGGAGRNLATALASGGAVRAGARVELYGVSGGTATFAAATSTDAVGQYQFAGLAAGSYLVRVQTGSVTSSRSGAVGTLLPVTTYMTDAGSGVALPQTDLVGGPAPATTTSVSTPGTTGTTVALPAALSEALSPVTVGSTAVTAVDFGFNFNTVTNTNDAGAGSLRQVITNANALGGEVALAQAGRTAGLEHVVFMIANGTAAAGLRASVNLFSTSPGNQAVAALAPATPLPAITSALTVDAQTQPGWTSVPVFDIDGANAGTGSTAHGLTVSAASTTVRGFVLRRFAQAGLSIGGAGVTVQGNHIGTNPAGTAAAANAGGGIVSSGAGTVIGGNTSTQRNLIAGNSGNGIQLQAAGAVITGNYIGTTVTGNAKLANTGHGIRTLAAGSVQIGGTTTGAGNIIGGAGYDGIAAVGTPTIQGNKIGLGADGTSNIANARNGIYAMCDAGGAVGGNVIAHNGSHGVLVASTCTGLAMRGNSMHSQAGLGIDLGDTGTANGTGDGATANDGAKMAGKANLQMDTPVFSAATLVGSTLTVAGHVGSAAGQSVFAGSQVEVFLADSAGSTPTGRTLLGVVSADASGNFTGSIDVPVGVTFTAGSTQLTGTATDGSGNTSEFGPRFAYGRAVAGTVFEDLNYGGGAGRSRAAASGVGIAGAVVELIGSDGVPIATTTTAADGSWRFAGAPVGHPFVRVVQSTLRSTRSGSNANVMGVLTWRWEASWTGAGAVTDQVGGLDPMGTDAAAGSASHAWTACAVEDGSCSFSGTRLVRYGAGTTWTTRVLTGGTACTNGVFGDPLVGTTKACQLLETPLHAVSSASTLAGDVSGIDFGFNFNTVTNTRDSGPGSLRQVITNANALDGDGSLAVNGRAAGIEHAVFMLSNGSSAAGLRSGINLFSGGVATIAPTSALPAITRALVIDAQRQPGWTLAPVVQISGQGAGAAVDGLTVASATGSTVRGLIINGFSGIGLSLAGGSGHTVAGNHVGTNAAGSAASGNGSVGVNLWTVANSTIGGSTPADRNVISGNGNSAIVIGGAGGTGNRVQGNWLGLNAAGNARLANGAQGLYVASADNQVVDNVISGNTWENLFLDTAASGTVVTGNLIGLDAAGAAALTNGGAGVRVLSPGNTLGGDSSALRNVIAGNGGDGIVISGSAASGNAVQGNHIGVNVAGSTVVPNSGAGIRVQSGASGNTVGGGSAGNLIRGNTGAGVALTGAGSNRVSRNALWGNGGPGIDLADNGVTANDGLKSLGQPNLLMDFPVFTEARARGNQLTVTGYVGAALPLSLFAGASIEVYVSDAHSSGHGGGQTWLGTLSTDATGAFTGTLTVPVTSLALGTRLTATATDSGGNTSEFGPNFAGLVVDFIVNTAADDADAAVGDGQCLTAAGRCSLRAAITELNAWSGLATPPTIAFALPGCAAAGDAGCTIAVLTALPTLTRSMVVDASTQPGFSASDLVPLVVLDGSTAASSVSGLTLGSGTHGVRGLLIQGFGQNGIVASAGTGHVIAGNWIGLATGGTSARPNGSAASATGGVYISAASAVRVGGSSAADRNVLSGNGGAGVWIQNGSGHTVHGNYIGTSASGDAAVGNGRWGVVVFGDDNMLGGSGAGEGNVIAGNLASSAGGIFITGNRNLVRGNRVGLAASGNTLLGNGTLAGIDIRGGQGNQIGGTSSSQGNRIAGNNGPGVRLASSAGAGNRISHNSIHDNGGLGIDLGADGVTANDGSLSTGKPNNGIDHPVISAAGVADTLDALTVMGAVGTGTGQAAFAGARVEFYKAEPDASGHGEGRTYLGSLTADGSGAFNGVLVLTPGTLAVGDSLTATAIGDDGSTSEFGPNWTTTTLAGLTPAGFNAFETDTPLAAISGVIRSKVAGAPASLAVVALDSGGLKLHGGFTGSVTLSWLDARDDSGSTSGSCRSSWPSLGAAGSVTFSTHARVVTSLTPPPSGTRVTRLKMRFSSGSTVVEACSSDAFAVLPASLTLAATDGGSASAGTTRTLDTTSASGGVVHRAGRPFTVTARALDATGALMTGYSGTPTLAAAACLLPAGCSPGALSSPASAAAAGIYTNEQVSYAEVGAVALQLTDADYGAVDSADTTEALRTVQSALVPVGRFVPDSLDVSVTGNGILATANAACLAAGQGATFIGQGFGWASAPQVTVTARNASGGTTTLWTGALMKLGAAAQVPSLAVAAAGTATAASSFGPITVTDLGGGQARLAASGTDRFLLDLPPGAAQPTVTPAWTWSLAVSDASEAAVAGNPVLSAAASQAAVPFDHGAAFHSGRLALSAGHGDARVGVRSLLQLQRLTTAGWVTMTEDRGCVTVQPQHVGVELPSGVFSSVGDCAAPMAAAATTGGGRAWLALPPTPGAAPGRLAVRLAGTAASGHSCTAGGAAATLKALDQPWLLGGSSGPGPLALLTWGLPNRDVVLRRETW